MRKQLWIIFLIIFTTFFISIKYVYAYIDPGTGAAVIGSLWPLIVAFFAAVGVFLVKIFWKPIKKGFSKIKRNKKDGELNNNHFETTKLS